MGWWASNLWQISPVLLVSWVFWVIASITLHELSHGWTAIRHGDDTPRLSGHMTPNPIVHMGPISLFVFALIGFAWGAMPIDPSRLRGRHAEAIVAAAGPAMNLSLAATCMVLAVVIERYAPSGGDAGERLRIFFAAGCMLNLVLAAFNMIPIPPLDGSRILAHYSGAYRTFASSPVGQGVMFIAMALMFFGAGRYLFQGAMLVYAHGRAALLPLLP